MAHSKHRHVFAEAECPHQFFKWLKTARERAKINIHIEQCDGCGVGRVKSFAREDSEAVLFVNPLDVVVKSGLNVETAMRETVRYWLSIFLAVEIYNSHCNS